MPPRSLCLGPTFLVKSSKKPPKKTGKVDRIKKKCKEVKSFFPIKKATEVANRDKIIGNPPTLMAFHWWNF